MADLQIRAILKDEFSAAAQSLIKEMQQIERAGATAATGVKALGSSVDASTASASKSSVSWTDLTAKYYMAAQALSVVKGATMAVVDAAARYDTITVRLNAFEGSAEAGARAMEKLQTLAKQPGLGLEQASSAYAGLRALKEDGPAAVAIIEAIAHANASMGGGANEFGRAMAQIQQMLGKGKLMAEDINTISESIPNFRALIMDAFGTTDTKALNAKYSIDELLKGIEQAAAKLPPPGETIRNNMDNIGDAWVRLKASLGDASTIKAATGFLAAFLDKLASAREGAAALEKREKVRGSVYTDAEKSLSGAMGGAQKLKDEAIIRAMQNGALGAGYLAASGSELTGYWATDAAAQAEKDAQAKKRSDARAKEVAELREEQAKQAKAYQRWVRENISGSGAQSVDFMSTEYGRETASAWSQRLRSGDQENDLYRREQAEKRAKDRAAENADLIKQDKEIQEQIRKFDEKEQERITRKYEEEWERRSKFAMQYADILSSTLASAYEDIWVNGRDTFDALYDAFSEMITKMAIEMAAKATIFGIFSAFGGGGLLGGAASYIFGGRASGGAMFPGVSYAYNERQGGEVFTPATAGMASPNYRGASSGDTIHIHLSGGASMSDANRIARAISQQKRERRVTVTRRG